MSKEVKIKITVDGKQVEKSVKDLTKEFNVAEKSVGEINQRLKELREAAQQVAVGSQDFKIEIFLIAYIQAKEIISQNQS